MLFIRGYYLLFSAFILALSKLGEAGQWLQQPRQHRQAEEKEHWQKSLVSSLPLREKKQNAETVWPALVK